MKKRFLTLIFVLFYSNIVLTQQNNIRIIAELDAEKDELKIQQEITYYNKSNSPLQEIYLHNWPNSFKNRKTKLTQRLIENYDKSLYFSNEKDKGFTNIKNITVNNEIANYQEIKSQIDILKIPLKKELAPKDSLTIIATYIVKIPNAKFTSYGKSKADYHLRYWHLIPSVTLKNNWQLMSNLDMDDLFMDFANYTIEFTIPKEYHLESSLNQKNEVIANKNIFYLSGNNTTDIIINISKKPKFKTFYANNIKVTTDIISNDLNDQLATQILTRAIDFLKQHIGTYPHSKLLVDKTTQSKNPIYGLNQLPNFLNPFSDVLKWDITLFKALTKKYIEYSLVTNKRTEYWLTDGFQIYLLMEYVKTYYPEIKLLGRVANFWGIKSFNFSKLQFNDKYPFVYQFSARQFLDQSLTTRADSLSNFNRKIVNKYKAGLGLQYLKGYLGDSVIEHAIKEYFENNKLKTSSTETFKKIIESKTTKDVSWFFGNYLQTNKKIDYTIKKVTVEEDSIKVTIKNKRNITAPVVLYGVQNKKIKFKKWFTKIDSCKTVTIPKGDFNKLSLNFEQLYPEYNTLDNWKKINKSLFNKPIQFKLIKDIEDPYYSQVYYEPDVQYNYYDGVILGLKLHNKPILSRNLVFNIIPSYSTKSNSLTGSISASYVHYLENSKIQKIGYGFSAGNSHYANNLSFNRFSPFFFINFKRKSLRDVGGKSLSAKLVSIDKETPLGIPQNEEDNYKIFNIRYTYSKPDIIKGLSYQISTDIAKNFTKIYTDIRYRKLTGTNRQLDFRLYAGAFLNNKTTSDYFSFGLDRPSDYLFEKNYFGRSEESGIFSQQIIISDGGFKSFLPTRYANEYIVSFNSSIGLWKWMEFYNDVAFLKNSGKNIYFAYENGIRLNFVHNILEFYFPLYSNLGWEINQSAYPSKIRFVFTANIGAIYNFLRRGFL